MAQVRKQQIIQVNGVELADVVRASWQKGDLVLLLRSGKSVRLCDLKPLRTIEQDALLSFPDGSRPLNLFSTAQDPLNPVNATGDARIPGLPFAVIEESDAASEEAQQSPSGAACFATVASLTDGSSAAALASAAPAATASTSASAMSTATSWIQGNPFLAGIPFAVLAGGLLGKRTADGATASGGDVTAPTVSITSNKTSLKAGESATVTFKFSEAPIGFTASDIKVMGGAVTNLAVSATDPSVYTATFTPIAKLASVSGVISVAAGTYTDGNGNLGFASVAPRVRIDTLGPSVTISSDKSLVKAGEAATITFTFSEAPEVVGLADFELDDL